MYSFFKEVTRQLLIRVIAVSFAVTVCYLVWVEEMREDQ